MGSARGGGERIDTSTPTQCGGGGLVRAAGEARCGAWPCRSCASGVYVSSSPTMPSTPRLRMMAMSALSACSARLRNSSRVPSASATMFSGS